MRVVLYIRACMWLDAGARDTHCCCDAKVSIRAGHLNYNATQCFASGYRINLVSKTLKIQFRVREREREIKKGSGF